MLAPMNSSDSSGYSICILELAHVREIPSATSEPSRTGKQATNCAATNGELKHTERGNRHAKKSLFSKSLLASKTSQHRSEKPNPLPTRRNARQRPRAKRPQSPDPGLRKSTPTPTRHSSKVKHKHHLPERREKNDRPKPAAGEHTPTPQDPSENTHKVEALKHAPPLEQPPKTGAREVPNLARTSRRPPPAHTTTPNPKTPKRRAGNKNTKRAGDDTAPHPATTHRTESGNTPKVRNGANTHNQKM